MADKKTYAASVLATKTDGNKISNYHEAFLVFAISKDEALGIAYSAAIKVYSEEKGYKNLSVGVSETYVTGE